MGVLWDTVKTFPHTHQNMELMEGL